MGKQKTQSNDPLKARPTDTLCVFRRNNCSKYYLVSASAFLGQGRRSLNKTCRFKEISAKLYFKGRKIRVLIPNAVGRRAIRIWSTVHDKKKCIHLNSILGEICSMSETIS